MASSPNRWATTPAATWSSGLSDLTNIDEVLERSRSLGFLGPGSVRVQRRHAEGFAHGVPDAPGRFLDIGSGGGVPGLVLALSWPESRAVLLDSTKRRCDFLVEAVATLGLGDRVEVVRSRAEDAGRDAALRGSIDLVVARSFGPPAVTAECAAPFLRVGGLMLVSEPPEADAREARWPADGLGQLGLVSHSSWDEPFHYRAFEQASPCPDRYPRRVGIPAKRPLF